MNDEDNNKWKLVLILRHMNNLNLLLIACMILYQMMLEKINTTSRIPRSISQNSNINRDKLMHKLINSGESHEIIRMNSQAFLNLCQKLESDGGLQSTKRIGIHEQVARFLYILGHNVKHRPIGFFFDRGRGTISRDFNKVLKAIIELESKYLQQPDGSTIPKEISEDHRFNSYFKVIIYAY